MLLIIFCYFFLLYFWPAPISLSPLSRFTLPPSFHQRLHQVSYLKPQLQSLYPWQHPICQSLNATPYLIATVYPSSDFPFNPPMPFHLDCNYQSIYSSYVSCVSCCATFACYSNGLYTDKRLLLSSSSSSTIT